MIEELLKLYKEYLADSFVGDDSLAHFMKWVDKKYWKDKK